MAEVARIASSYRGTYPGLFRVLWTVYKLFDAMPRWFLETGRDEGAWKSILSGPEFLETRFASVTELRAAFAQALIQRMMGINYGNVMNTLYDIVFLVVTSYGKFSPWKLSHQSTREKDAKMQPMEQSKSYSEYLVHARIALDTVLTRDDMLSYEDLVSTYEREIASL